MAADGYIDSQVDRYLVNHVCFANPEIKQAFSMLMETNAQVYLVIDKIESNGHFQGKVKP